MDGGRSLGLVHAFVVVLLHFMIPAATLGFDAKEIGCIEREREALLEFKQGLVDDYGRLSSWGIEDHKTNCCEWRGVRCSYSTGHVVELDLRDYTASDYMAHQPLRGKIPTGTQLQTFSASSFTGNLALCGRPLTLECIKKDDDNGKSNEDNHEVEDEFKKWLYIGMGSGYAVGFWGVFGSLLLNRSWRHAYFLFLANLKDWLYVTVTVHKARLQRLFQS